MSDLPQGWERVPLGNLIELNPKTIAVEDCTEVGFVPMTLLGKRWFDVPSFELRQWVSVKKGYTHFQDGDVLLAKITPCFENGKAGLLRGLPNGIGSGSTEYFVCRTADGTLDSRYLLAYLKTDDFVHTGAMLMTGSVGHKRVPKEYLLGREIPLAPKREQTRIANQLDTLLARVQACNDRFDAIPALLKRFRQTVLSAAVTGVLTASWREDHIESVFPWTEVRICDAGQVQLGRQRSPKYHSGEYMRPYLRVQNVFEDRFDLSDVMEMDFPPEDFEKYQLHPGDILLNEGQSPKFLGRPAIYRGELPGACFTNTLIRFKAFPHVVPEYALLVFRHQMHSGRYVEEGKITTNIAHLGAGRFAEVEFPLPTHAEQTEIVRRVEALFALADRIEARCTAARTHAQRLTPLVLTKAFRGELVPQDPNDEPASALLARTASSNTAVAGKNMKQVPVAQKSRAQAAINL